MIDPTEIRRIGFLLGKKHTRKVYKRCVTLVKVASARSAKVRSYEKQRSKKLRVTDMVSSSWAVQPSTPALPLASHMAFFM